MATQIRNMVLEPDNRGAAMVLQAIQREQDRRFTDRQAEAVRRRNERYRREQLGIAKARLGVSKQRVKEERAAREDSKRLHRRDQIIQSAVDAVKDLNRRLDKGMSKKESLPLIRSVKQRVQTILRRYPDARANAILSGFMGIAPAAPGGAAPAESAASSGGGAMWGGPLDVVHGAGRKGYWDAIKAAQRERVAARAARGPLVIGGWPGGRAAQPTGPNQLIKDIINPANPQFFQFDDQTYPQWRTDMLRSITEAKRSFRLPKGLDVPTWVTAPTPPWHPPGGANLDTLLRYLREANLRRGFTIGPAPDYAREPVLMPRDAKELLTQGVMPGNPRIPFAGAQANPVVPNVPAAALPPPAAPAAPAAPPAAPPPLPPAIAARAEEAAQRAAQQQRATEAEIATREANRKLMEKKAFLSLPGDEQARIRRDQAQREFESVLESGNPLLIAAKRIKLLEARLKYYTAEAKAMGLKSPEELPGYKEAKGEYEDSKFQLKFGAESPAPAPATPALIPQPTPPGVSAFFRSLVGP